MAGTNYMKSSKMNLIYFLLLQIGAKSLKIKHLVSFKMKLTMATPFITKKLGSRVKKHFNIFEVLPLNEIGSGSLIPQE